MPWDPEQYLKFKQERFVPFDDLLALVEVREGMSAVDLGCGNGELTRRIADYLPGSRVLGIDSSPQMLEKAEAFRRPGLDFRVQEIAAVSGSWDLVISNAALHWIDDQESMIKQIFSLVSPGGQLAVQVPSNHRHPSHAFIIETAGEEPFRNALHGWARHSPVLEIDAYARLLHQCGASRINVFEKVYCHRLPDADAVAEWTRGTTMVPYLERLPEALREPFLERYQQKLRVLWPSGEVFYTFRRTFFAAMRNI
jgi:trans-aconitate 2-methyltransferase